MVTDTPKWGKHMTLNGVPSEPAIGHTALYVKHMHLLGYRVL